MEAEKQRKLHVALLPWLAFGHLNPFLHLAIALADASIHITYLSTPRNIRRLPLNTIPPHLSSRIKFHPLSLPQVDGLPNNAESTNDLTAPDQNPLLGIAFDGLQDQVKAVLSGDDAPHHLLYDLHAYWAPQVGAEAGGVPCSAFSIVDPIDIAYFGRPPEGADTDDDEGLKQWWPSAQSLTSKPEWIPFTTNVEFQKWEAEQLYRIIFGYGTSGVRVITRCIGSFVNSSGAVLIRASNEYDPVFLDLLPEMWGKPIIPVGWLPPTVFPVAPAIDSGVDERWAKTRQWLDGKAPKSVVLVIFGSESQMDKAAIFELAHGLELSGVQFLWVLRRPEWLGGDEEDGRALPDGFRSRMEGRGLVTFGYAPQLEILAHKSIGGMLFQVGATSLIEALSHGLVLVLLPLLFSTGLTARRLVEKGLGVEIERNEDDGSFDRNGVAKALKTAMVSDESEKLREKARALSAAVSDRAVHDRYIKGVVDFLMKSKKS